MQSSSATEKLELELKQLIIESLKLEDVAAEDIASDEPLFGEGLGLDSIDALELGVMLRKRYNITIATVTPEVKAHFANIRSLALFISFAAGAGRMTRDELLHKLQGMLHELFEIPPEKVTPDAKLFEELDLDSIDAIDLIVKVQALTGRRVSPQDFKNVRTVGDVLDCIEKLLATDEQAQAQA